jgi:hypothetical protein
MPVIDNHLRPLNMSFTASGKSMPEFQAMTKQIADQKQEILELQVQISTLVDSSNGMLRTAITEHKNRLRQAYNGYAKDICSMNKAFDGILRLRRDEEQKLQQRLDVAVIFNSGLEKENLRLKRELDQLRQEMALSANDEGGKNKRRKNIFKKMRLC